MTGLPADDLRARCASAARALLPLLILFAVLLTVTWGRLPDVQVDFGRELYVAWRLAEGAALYRDVMYINGPLSPYVNALWFRIFGTGIGTLMMANAAIALLVLLLLWQILARLGSEVSATVAGAVFLLVFAFAQQLPIGNYNFIAPYSHETTHGVVLGLAAVLAVGWLARSGATRATALCGLCAGLALLTKPEVVLAIWVATLGGGTLALLGRRTAPRVVATHVAAFVASAAVPPILAAALLSLALPPHEALANTFGGLRWIGHSALASPFYLRMAGLLDPYGAAGRIAGWSIVWATLLGGAALLGRALPGAGRVRHVAPALVFALVLGLALLVRARIPWAQALLPLPLVTLGGVVGFVSGALRDTSGRERERLVVGATLSLLALGLLAKMVLRARAIHYGFALVLPATMLAIVLVWDWLPRIAARGSGARATVRAAFLGALSAFVVMHAETSARFLGAKTVPVGTGRDAFVADERGIDVARALAQIAAVVPADATVAVLPTGAMLGYLARRPSSVRYVDFDPFVVELYGESAMLDAFRAHPPDFVVLVDSPIQEYGARGFGDGYAEQLAAWIGMHYRPLGRGTAGSIVLLRRSRA